MHLTWLSSYNTDSFAEAQPLEIYSNVGIIGVNSWAFSGSYRTLSLHDPCCTLCGSVSARLVHYILSAKENPYELDSKSLVLLMELNIYLWGFKTLKA